MSRKGTWLALGILVTAGSAAVPVAAQAQHGEWQWRHDNGRHRGWERHGWHDRDANAGAVIGGALLGLGVGAAIAGTLAPPPAYYAPPPVYYQPYAYGAPGYSYYYGY
jgi:hypothetical protein